VELELCALIPREKWSEAHHWLIWQGRRVCQAQKPRCDICPLSALCPEAAKVGSAHMFKVKSEE
jgi:endonuclease-3